MNDPKKLASKGRYGDTMLAHINPEEAALLKSRGGAGTINPKTGLPEFYGQWQMKQMEEQKKAEAEAATAAAKAKASAEKSAAASRALTPEQRQANIARDQALSQIRGARPSGQDSQFYQPAYQPQYNNYVNPLLSGNVAAYGTNPGPSAGYMAAMAPGGQGLSNYYQSLQQLSAQQSNQPYGMDYATFNPARKAMGASQNDLMAAYSYNPMQGGGMGGGLTPEMARSLMQRSMTSSGVPTSEFQKFGGYDTVKALYDKSGGDYSGQGNPYPQQQFNPYTNQYQTPFSYQQPQYQQQMQTPFSYQQPMQQPVAQRLSSGPSQAIVGRSSQMRGTPNVMRRAEGGITSLLKKSK
jgi:hypothetical protein